MKKNIEHNSIDTKNFKEALNQAVKNVGTAASSTTEKAKTALTKSKDSILKTIDTNGNGEIGIEFIWIDVDNPPSDAIGWVAKDK